MPFFYALLFELKILFYFLKKVISSKLLVEKKKKHYNKTYDFILI